LIILDTNVISEPMKLRGDPAVQAWLDRQEAETLYITATSLSELLVGIELVPTGKRRANLARSLTRLLEKLFGPRILPFDRRAAIGGGRTNSGNCTGDRFHRSNQGHRSVRGRQDAYRQSMDGLTADTFG
jgi:predicted nucleic acid-binding protein